MNITKITEARQFLNLHNREVGEEIAKSEICEFFNCQEADFDDNGNIYIEGPQRGHWIDDDGIIEYAAWNRSR